LKNEKLGGVLWEMLRELEIIIIFKSGV